MLNLINHDHGIREIQLARPPVNALNLELLRALRTAIDDSVRDGVRGIVLSGAQGLFSAGVDVPALLALRSRRRARVLARILRAVRRRWPARRSRWWPRSPATARPAARCWRCSAITG